MEQLHTTVPGGRRCGPAGRRRSRRRRRPPSRGPGAAPPASSSPPRPQSGADQTPEYIKKGGEDWGSGLVWVWYLVRLPINKTLKIY